VVDSQPLRVRFEAFDLDGANARLSRDGSPRIRQPISLMLAHSAGGMLEPRLENYAGVAGRLALLLGTSGSIVTALASEALRGSPMHLAVFCASRDSSSRPPSW
jgi:hypothetical protein